MGNLLTEVQVAEQLNLSRLTLKAWRCEGRGPKFLKFPGKTAGSAYTVRYRPEDLDAWLAAIAIKRQVDQPTSRSAKSVSGTDLPKRTKRNRRRA